jgi:hypothetical protein
MDIRSVFTLNYRGNQLTGKHDNSRKKKNPEAITGYIKAEKRLQEF